MAATASKTRRARWEVLPSTKTERKEDGPLPWKVTRDGERIGAFDTQAKAIRFAVTTARCAWQTTGQLATLKIKRPDGTIRDERTYGRDPSRTKG